MHLDFSTQAFLTDGKGTITKGIDGQPMRQAQDVASNKRYVQIMANIPTDLTDPKAATRRATIDSLLEAGTLVSESGHGVWCLDSDVTAVLNTLK